MVVRKLISRFATAGERRIEVRVIAMLCALALFVTPMCGAKCLDQGCAARDNSATQKNDDCHAASGLSADGFNLAGIHSFHRCWGSEQLVLTFAEAKLTVAWRSSLGIGSVHSAHDSTPSDVSSFSFGARAATNDTGGVPHAFSPSTVLRI